MATPPRSGPPERVPTLTEVLESPGPAEVLPDRGSGAAAPAPDDADGLEASRAGRDAELAERLRADMQQILDRVVDARIAAVVEPLLEEMAARMLQQLRTELASSLREAMQSALDREMARHRGASEPR